MPAHSKKYVDNMERERFSGNILNQNKGFGRIEPGLRYVNSMLFMLFNSRVVNISFSL